MPGAADGDGTEMRMRGGELERLETALDEVSCENMQVKEHLQGVSHRSCGHRPQQGVSHRPWAT